MPPKANSPVWYKTTAEFTVRDEEANLYVCQWLFEPNVPVQRKSGVSGWANVNGELARLHVCYHDPCIAKHHKSKYGHMPEPMHCRLVATRPPSPITRDGEL